MTDPARSLAPARRMPAPGPRKPSVTRPASCRRRRLVNEAKKGNVNALRHGAFAAVQAQPDVATEIELIYATHPALDDLEDRRLVESLATASVMCQRAILAMEAQGWSQALTSYQSRMATLAERLERAVHDRHKERLNDRKRGKVVDVSQYAPRRLDPGASA